MRPASELARRSLTSKPSRASATAGSTRPVHPAPPYRSWARAKPATVPGTPTARWLRWWIREEYSPSSSRNIRGWARRGAFSLKSNTVELPSGKRITMNPPPPMLPATGCVTASANPVAMAASTALPPARSTAAPARLACGYADTTIPPSDRRTPPGDGKVGRGRRGGAAGGEEQGRRYGHRRAGLAQVHRGSHCGSGCGRWERRPRRSTTAIPECGRGRSLTVRGRNPPPASERRCIRAGRFAPRCSSGE